jgi:hypothetical protein
LFTAILQLPRSGILSQSGPLGQPRTVCGDRHL